MSSIKLAVEVLDAHELMAKDGEDSSDPFVELRFDRQKFRTTTKDKDLNPVWNEKFYFNITDPSLLHDLTLNAFVYHYKKSNSSRIFLDSSRVFLGKVCLTRTSFVPYPDAVALHYPLERRFFFSPYRVSGELGLKVFVTDDPSLRSPNNMFREPSIDSDIFSTHDPTLTSTMLNMFSRKRNQFRQKYHNIPNSDQEEGEEQPSSPPTAENPTINSGMHEVKSGLAPPKVVGGYTGSLPLKDRALKEISSFLGVTRFIHGNKLASTYDLVEPMHYLFVRVVKARDLPSNILIGGIDPYVQVKVGNFEGATFHWEKTLDPEWHQVFAFARDDLQSTKLQVRLRDKRTMIKDDIVGTVKFDLHEVPTRIPPNSPLAPEWYRIDKCWDKKKGELMLAVWFGTQADEAFPEAWHSDAPSLGISSSSAYAQIRSKIYHSPRLWYLQVRVIEAQDLYLSEDCEIQLSDAYVKLQLGNQILKTRPVHSRNMNLRWDQELMFIAAEPLEEPLIVSVENRVEPDHIETIGIAVIPLTNVYKRADDKVIRTRWYALEDERKDDDDPVSTIHLSVCLEGGYHVFDESNHNYSSDLRPTSRQLWKEPIGILELGILSINGLHPMKTRGGKGTSDTYCVAKYGQKWIRTRTIADSVKPKYNEQYSWEVYDPATVLTVGVFDNVQLGGSDDDLKLGKVRIRISTLETGRVYKNSYPLLMLHPSGVKKMGELHLAIRFSCSSMVDMMRMYFKPPLPKMHYKLPLNIRKQERLRQEAVNVVAARFGNAEPPLRKEVVEFMSDTDSHLWSMRRSKANFYRLMTLISGLLLLGGWLEEVFIWKHPLTTLVVHILFVMLVCFPGVIMPAMLLYMFAIGMWNLRFRMRHPPHMSTRISYPDGLSPDELDEEFDTFPTTKSHDIVCLRYDRLRTVAMRIQGVVGDLATQGERFQALVNWRDPHATALFMAFCIVAAIVLYVTPFQFPIVLAGFYIMRHPTFRSKIPSAPLNFFLRLPSRTDSML